MPNTLIEVAILFPVIPTYMYQPTSMVGNNNLTSVKYISVMQKALIPNLQA